jgi:glutamyl-tRNA synthetase
MSNKLLADLLFPQVTFTSEDMERRYPERGDTGEKVITRIGPSPTGFIHLGNLYNAVIAERLAHQSGGSFYLRIEDTDNKQFSNKLGIANPLY